MIEAIYVSVGARWIKLLRVEDIKNYPIVDAVKITEIMSRKEYEEYKAKIEGK